MQGYRWELKDHQKPVLQYCTARQTTTSDQYPNGKGGLVVVPPGGGKTWIIGALVLAEPWKATVVVVPAHLVNQTAKVLEQMSEGRLEVTKVTKVTKNSTLSQLTSTTVLVCSFSVVKKASFAALCPKRIIVGEHLNEIWLLSKALLHRQYEGRSDNSMLCSPTVLALCQDCRPSSCS